MNTQYVDDDISTGTSRPLHDAHPRKTALIMEGGAMRGMFTGGVLDVFLENDIRFDGAAGISAGALFGSNFKSKQVGRSLRYNKKYCGDPRFCSIRSLITTGDLYGADFCYNELPSRLDPFDVETFGKNPMTFYVGATDVFTGRCIYHQCVDGKENDLAWMRASASMPLVSRPVAVDGHLLLDGGISDSVPYEHMERLGYRTNVIILTQPEGYRKKKNSAYPLLKLLLHQYPALAAAMGRRHIMYNRQMEEIAQREEAGTSCVIRPPRPLGIRRTETDPSELERVYHIGRKEAEKSLPRVQEFLGGEKLANMPCSGTHQM